jgi:hypothetical protein
MCEKYIAGIRYRLAGFEDHSAVLLRVKVFWDVTLWRLINTEDFGALGFF